MRLRYVLCALLTVIFLTGTSIAVVPGQIDDFNDNTTQNWQRGNIALGGPGGAADPFLQLTSTGTGGPNSRLVTFNQAQWSGDYVAADVGAISMFLMNNGTSNLLVRIAIGDNNAPLAGGTWFASTEAVELDPLTGWIEATFSLAESDLTQIQGPLTYNDVMTGAVTLRILHSTAPSALGGVIPAQLGVDNITALESQVPVSGKSWSIVKSLYRD